MKAIVHDAASRGGSRFREYVRKLWQSRGGGFYGFVAVLMFLYLEGLDLAGDIAALPDTFAANIWFVFGWVLSNFIDAVLNMVKAAIWPVEWIGRFGVGIRSAVLLGAAYAAYRLARPYLLRLLGDPRPQPAVQSGTRAATATGAAPSLEGATDEKS